MVAEKSAPASLKEYLKKYESNNEEEEKKKKKKKKKATKLEATGVLVVDEDPVWQKPVNIDEEEENDSPDEKPQIDEDIEVKRMRRLEQLRAKRPYHGISEDGSGWVSISNAPKGSGSTDPISDISPPRKRRARYDSPSPEPETRPSELGGEATDLSPPRQRGEATDLSPPRQRRRRNDSSSREPKQRPLASVRQGADLSPLRQRRKRYDSPSPEPSGIGREDSDMSPPRKHRRLKDSPLPQPKSKPSIGGDEVVDLSPPRKHRRRYDSSSPEPGRKPLDSAEQDVDLSPPRQHRRRGVSSSSKPEHKASVSGRQASDVDDISPPRRVRHRSPALSDLRRPAVEDLSPPRRNQKSAERLGPSDNGRSHVSTGADLSPPRKTKEKPKTGLVTGRDIKEEIAKTREDDLLRFQKMDASISGRGAEPVYRDKKGGRISKEEYLKSTRKEEKKPKEEKKLEWGKGLAQKREAEARQLELENEKDKPFARSRDDPELDTMLKERVRWGDPMAHLAKKKQFDAVLPDLGENDKMKESGFIVPQEIPPHSWIRRGIDAAPNRYGIKPGRHWDGVDRSTGYEKELFKRMNEKRATEREAYLWSVSDM